jgi:hypothetical protein
MCYLSYENLIFCKDIHIPTNFDSNTVYKSVVTNMATVQNFEFVPDKFIIE